MLSIAVEGGEVTSAMIAGATIVTAGLAYQKIKQRFLSPATT
jgi:hypothetical protein